MKIDHHRLTPATDEADFGPIVVVDDSRLQRRILVSLLKKLGHSVLEFDDAQAALEACRAGKASIVVSDWMMPGMDGLAFCRALRDSELKGYVYFILLTSKSDKEDIAVGLDAGADDFLTKPVNGDELRARIVAGQRILSMQSELRGALEELRGVYDALDKDLIEARKLQHSLIRDPRQLFGDADVELYLQSSGRVGGDLVGAYPICDGRFGVYSIDVSGHGVASALLSARIAGYLSASSPDQNIALKTTTTGYVGVSPNIVVGLLNRLVLEEIETEHYFTIALAEIDLTMGQVRMCQAGHPSVLVQRADGSVEYQGDGGLPVGLIEDASWEAHRFPFGQGDRLFLYSDGVTECENPDGQQFGEDGLAGLFAEGPQDRFFDRLIGRLADFSGSDEFGDDVSGLLVQRLNSPIR